MRWSKLLDEAGRVGKRRAHVVLSQPEDPVQRLVVAIAVGSYSRPHRFANGPQTFAVLFGELAILMWRPNACTLVEPSDVALLTSGDVFDMRPSLDLRPSTEHASPPGAYHSLYPITPCVVAEILTGPFREANRQDVRCFPPEVGRGATSSDEVDAARLLAGPWREAIRVARRKVRP